MKMAFESDERTLYVSNLARDVSDDLLFELFLQAGPIERVTIPKSSHASSRYGFVTYKHICSVDYAIELYKGTKLFEREINVRRKNQNSSQHNTQNINSSHNNRAINENFKNFSLRGQWSRPSPYDRNMSRRGKGKQDMNRSNFKPKQFY